MCCHCTELVEESVYVCVCLYWGLKKFIESHVGTDIVVKHIITNGAYSSTLKWRFEVGTTCICRFYIVLYCFSQETFHSTSKAVLYLVNWEKSYDFYFIEVIMVISNKYEV